MLLGMSLVLVGFVLTLNGLWLLKAIEDRGIILINCVVALLSFLIAIHTAVTAVDISHVRSATMIILFATTYLWVAYNRVVACDGRGLGWFSLLVAVTVAPMAVRELTLATTAMDVWLGLSWLSWVGLWALYFCLLALQKPVLRVTAIFTLLCGVFSAWLPGMLILFEVAP